MVSRQYANWKNFLKDSLKDEDAIPSVLNHLSDTPALDGLLKGNDETPNLRCSSLDGFLSPADCNHCVFKDETAILDSHFPDSDSLLMSDIDLPLMVDKRTLPREGDHDTGRERPYRVLMEERKVIMWKELMSSMTNIVPRKLQEVESSCRSMLQRLKSVTVNISNNLREGVDRLKDGLYRHFDRMTRSVHSFSISSPKARKWLPISIDRIIAMCKGDVEHLLQETSTLFVKLGNFEKQIFAQELSMTDCFEKCASSIKLENALYLSLESSLWKQNSNNISVASSSE